MQVIEAIDVSTDAATIKPAKVRRRANSKPSADNGNGNGKRSLNIRVDDDTYERLAVHALRRKTTISELVMEFAKTQLREFTIHRNAVNAVKGE